MLLTKPTVGQLSKSWLWVTGTPFWAESHITHHPTFRYSQNPQLFQKCLDCKSDSLLSFESYLTQHPTLCYSRNPQMFHNQCPSPLFEQQYDSTWSYESYLTPHSTLCYSQKAKHVPSLTPFWFTIQILLTLKFLCLPNSTQKYFRTRVWVTSHDSQYQFS